jgi:type IV pilus assembly protein PilA
MRNRKGFTLIELMVVVLIVAVLAAVLIPLISARIEAAKWTEGKAGAGTIATAIRAYAVENDYNAAKLAALAGNAGVLILFKTSDLQGKYFTSASYSITGTPAYTAGGTPNEMTYAITVTAPTGWKVPTYVLDQTGTWTP